MFRAVAETVENRVLVEKTWGSEEWIVNNDSYCGKLILVNKGRHTSIHFHSLKHETMYCLKGHFRIEMSDPTTGERYDVELSPGSSVVIQQNQPHAIWGVEDENILIEFSTPHCDTDSYRVSRPG